MRGGLRSLGLAAILILGVGCTDTGGAGGNAEIAEIRQTEDPRVLELSVNTCNAELLPEIIETRDDVTLSVASMNDATGEDCQDQLQVELERDLGDRAILLSDGSTFRSLPYPTPKPISDSTPDGSIAFCGRDDFEAPDAAVVSDDADLGTYYGNVDLATFVAQQYRSDSNWRGLSGRNDPSDGYVFVFRFSEVKPELEDELAEQLGDVRFEVAPAEFGDDELEAAALRVRQDLEAAGLDTVTGVENGSNNAVPGRVVIHLVDPLDGLTLAEDINLIPPYGTYCIWPNPSPNGPTNN